MTQDDLVIPRKMYIDDLKSAKELDGKTVWMQAGYQLTITPIESILLYSATRKVRCQRLRS